MSCFNNKAAADLCAQQIIHLNKNTSSCQVFRIAATISVLITSYKDQTMKQLLILSFLLSSIVFSGFAQSESSKVIVPENPADISPLLIGESVPALKLTNASGTSFDLNRAISERPTILVFYRGGWGPFCSIQLSGLQEIENDLKKMGYQIIAVSTDSPENLSNTLGDQKFSYTLLSDANLAAAKQFGIAYKGPKNYEKLYRKLLYSYPYMLMIRQS